MAQGTIKKTSSSALSAKSKKPASTALTRRGSRIIAPKKAKIVARRKLTKTHSSGLNAMTEKNLAEKAGHLEMLVGGKTGKKERDRARDGERRVVRTAGKKGKLPEVPGKGKEISSGEVVV